MAAISSCPRAEDLQRLLLGQTGEEEAEPLESHLLQCEQCQQTARSLSLGDTLISALKKGQEVASKAPPIDLLEQLRQHLRAMRSAPPAMETTTADTPPPAQPSLDVTQEGGPSLAPPRDADEIGRLGGYRVLKELGQGGMGVVYQAEDPKLKRLVALKVMKPSLAADDAARARFLREAQAMAAVRHTHIATIYQVDEDRGVPFLAMEFLEGLPLDKWLAAGDRPDLTQVLRIGREIAQGLAAAHEHGLIHRDVKPGNIWLDSAHQGQVKILDFGLARPARKDAHLTRSGAIVGTPAYMAPEQARGEPVDARADLFSLGCVLYRLCTGATPFAGDTTMAVLTALAVDNPTPVNILNPEVPAELSDLVMRLLAKDRKDRPASARAVIEALQAIEHAGTAEGQRAPAQLPEDRTELLPVKPPAGKPARRRRRLVLAATALGLLASVAALALALIRIQTPEGDYVIDTDDPDFSLSVSKGEVTLEDRKTNRKYKVRVLRQDQKTGEMELEVADADAGLSFKTPMFTIKRGEKVALKAWFERTPAVAVKPLDPAWLKKVATLPPDKQVEEVAAKLKERNPGFDGKVNHEIEGGAVTYLQFLTDNVTDLSPVRGLTRLRGLDCAGSDAGEGRGRGQLADLSPLGGMALTHLDCSRTKVADLLPLKGMPLKSLSCGGTPVSDLSPLKDMKLTRLWCWGTRVADLSPLEWLPLKELCCDLKSERDLEVVRRIKTLEKLNGKPVPEALEAADWLGHRIDDAWLKQVAALPAEKQLEAVVAKLKERNPGFDGKVLWHQIDNGMVTHLELEADHITDLSPVRALTGLTYLNCHGSAPGKGKLADLSPLKGMRLEHLLCFSTSVTDLSPLGGMKLTYLNCAGTKVADLSPLKDMKLTALRCNGTPVSDLSPLKGMPLTGLGIEHTAITDLSPLKGMRLGILHCRGTRATDLSPLKDMPLEELSCDFKPERDAAILRSVTTLKRINLKPAAQFWREVDGGK